MTVHVQFSVGMKMILSPYLVHHKATRVFPYANGIPQDIVAVACPVSSELHPQDHDKVSQSSYDPWR